MEKWTGTISWAQCAHFFRYVSGLKNGDHQTKEGIMLHIGTTHFWVELPYGNQAPYNVTLPTIRVRTTGTLDSLPLFYLHSYRIWRSARDGKLTLSSDLRAASPMIRYDTPR
ncbi:hypothetical protein ACJX0J_002996 (mitochondrion) [Zea mays]